MNKEQIFGMWNEISGKLKQQYADLTDDDLLYEQGQEEELIGKIQKKTGQTREQLEKQLRNFSQDLVLK